MKYKKHFEQHQYPIIQLLSNDDIEKINSLMGTHYTKATGLRAIRVEYKQKDFSFWDKLIRGKPGFDKEYGEKN